MSSSNNSGRTGSESSNPDSIHVRCAKGTGDRVHEVAEASFTSKPEWLRWVVLEALEKEEKLVAPSPLEPSAGTRARLASQGEGPARKPGARAYPEHVRVSCPSGTNERIVLAAQRSGTSRSEWVRRALVRVLDVYEPEPGARGRRPVR